jgi:hypothetical protein
MPVKKVLWVKFGWSDYYRGGVVDGNFGWLNDNKGKKNEGRGHEAFNFNPGPDGTYYCYVPPQAKVYAPSNSDPDGWTVICLAKHPRHTGIHIVGWYEDATLHGEWLEPPDRIMKRRGDTIHPAYDWSYCISSPTAFFIPPERRVMPFSDNSVRQGKYSFLEGPGVHTDDNKRRVLRLLEDRVEALLPLAVSNPSEVRAPDPELDKADPLIGFGTAEHRKKVEKAAEDAVVGYFHAKKYTCQRVTDLPCGYDFIFTKGKSVLHVEVKGTVSSFPQFYLTRNEYAKGLLANPVWHLVMVSNALSDAPVIDVYNAAQLKKAFELEPYVFIGKIIPNTD